MSKGWTITWGMREWSDDKVDFTGADLADLQILTGKGWNSLDPWGGPLELMSMIAVLETRDSGRDVREVFAELRDSPADELMGAIKARET
jgi:hypothetical protein